ncbi:sigma-54-dependent transcriptional regulator [Marinivivus vitaminiproducens]|uniref:sigma-54-dependent transcriptional regulator n=1 Tax=Marinivivus vitaminiproducens TaxID=3035935 RepID=UPI003F9F9EF5
MEHRRGVTDRSATQGRILLIEDTLSLAQVYTAWLAKGGIEVRHETTGADGLQALAEESFPVVLLDLQLPDVNGIDLIEAIRGGERPAAVIVITANASLSVAVDAMRRGAHDFLVKPIQSERMIVSARNALETSTLRQRVEVLRQTYERTEYQGFIGASPAMQAVYRTIEAAATSKATVFITGESGTGKELCAEAIHRSSERRARPFIAINCGAIPRELIESELFGHVKGAFTGAVNDRAGAAREAHGGTLFLDEIGEMSIDLQTKLLRFLQTGQVQRVGETKIETVDVRIVCATNRDPLAEIRAGRFREDLYFRLYVIPIAMPPLRSREGDVIPIARHFLDVYAHEDGRRFQRFDLDAEARLAAYDWPGNIRQLQNVIRNAVVLHDGEALTAAMLPPLPSAASLSAAPSEATDRPAVVSKTLVPSPDDDGTIKPMWQVQDEAVERAIRICEGNISKAAALLEINPSTIYRRRAANRALKLAQ